MKTTVTVIEDDDDQRRLVSLSLEAAGYFVIPVSLEDDLVLEVKRNPTDIYLIDINLGLLNGCDLCRQLKSEFSDRASPFIVVVSAHPDAVGLADEAGADDVLLKPFTSKQLLSAMSNYSPQAA